MRYSILVAAITALMTFAGHASATTPEPARLLAAGEWSKPVADADGYAVRGRLVLCESAVEVGGRAHFPREQRRAIGVYVELQEAGGFVGRSLRIFCDFARTDFRPEHKSGLWCELLDKDRRPVAPTPAPFGGGIPASEWVTLPPDATLRLRSSPFGIHRANALAIAPSPQRLWVIEENDPNDYFLAGTFTVDPALAEKLPAQERPPAGGAVGVNAQIWRGTIDLPAVRINSRDHPPTSRPSTATSRSARSDYPSSPNS